MNWALLGWDGAAGVLHCTKQPHATQGREGRVTHFAKCTKKNPNCPRPESDFGHSHTYNGTVATKVLIHLRSFEQCVNPFKQSKTIKNHLGRALNGHPARSVIQVPGNRWQYCASPMDRQDCQQPPPIRAHQRQTWLLIPAWYLRYCYTAAGLNKHLQRPSSGCRILLPMGAHLETRSPMWPSIAPSLVVLKPRNHPTALPLGPGLGMLAG